MVSIEIMMILELIFVIYNHFLFRGHAKLDQRSINRKHVLRTRCHVDDALLLWNEEAVDTTK